MATYFGLQPSSGQHVVQLRYTIDVNTYTSIFNEICTSSK